MTQRTPVESSSIASIGHDPATNELHVEFKSGAVHVYSDVSPEKHRDLLTAPSIGQHFHRHVRNAHASRKLGE